MEYSFGIPLSTRTTVNQDVSDRQTKYIRTRIDQLREDMAKAHDPLDQQWYQRCIQELEWVQQMRGKPTHNCYMKPAARTYEQDKIDSDAKGNWF